LSSFLLARAGSRTTCEVEATLDVSPARDRSFRDFVLVRKHPVAPNSLN
jgi:hypothetical protein